MYEARQNKEKVSRRIDGGGMARQMARINSFVRNVKYQNPMSNAIQYYLGRKRGEKTFACSCLAEVVFKDSDSPQGTVKKKGEGGNSGSEGKTEDSKVLSIFNGWDLKNLETISEKDNPPGRCAEPHAVADALEHSPEHKNNSEILNITVSPAKTNDNTEKDRCQTCRQWVPTTEVLSVYLLFASSGKYKQIINNKSIYCVNSHLGKDKMLSHPIYNNTPKNLNAYPGQYKKDFADTYKKIYYSKLSLFAKQISENEFNKLELKNIPQDMRQSFIQQYNNECNRKEEHEKISNFREKKFNSVKDQLDALINLSKNIKTKECADMIQKALENLFRKLIGISKSEQEKTLYKEMLDSILENITKTDIKDKLQQLLNDTYSDKE